MKYSAEYYADFQKIYPRVAQDFGQRARACHQAGPLDTKSRRLIKVGIAIGIGSEGDLQSHVIQALEEGVTADEIRHAILQSLTTAGFPKMIVAMRWAEEIIGDTK